MLPLSAPLHTFGFCPLKPPAWLHGGRRTSRRMRAARRERRPARAAGAGRAQTPTSSATPTRPGRLSARPQVATHVPAPLACLPSYMTMSQILESHPRGAEPCPLAGAMPPRSSLYMRGRGHAWCCQACQEHVSRASDHPLTGLLRRAGRVRAAGGVRAGQEQGPGAAQAQRRAGGVPGAGHEQRQAGPERHAAGLTPEPAASAASVAQGALGCGQRRVILRKGCQMQGSEATAPGKTTVKRTCDVR